MGISVNEIITGRKTFFILPDTSLMPPSYLEDLFALGFECYYISHDTRIKTEKKIETILSLFKDVILYLNIDYELPGVNWSSLIYDLVQVQGKGDSIGIMYAKRQSRGEKEKIEHEAVHNILSPLLDREKIEELFLEFDAHETKEAIFAYQCDKLECDIQCKLYDKEGYVDLNHQENNDTASDELVKELLEQGKSWSDMWLEYSQRKYPYDANFIAVSNYLKEK